MNLLSILVTSTLDTTHNASGFFVISSKRWRERKGAEHLGTHQIEDLQIAELRAGETFAGLTGLLPRIDALVYLKT